MTTSGATPTTWWARQSTCRASTVEFPTFRCVCAARLTGAHMPWACRKRQKPTHLVRAPRARNRSIHSGHALRARTWGTHLGDIQQHTRGRLRASGGTWQDTQRDCLVANPHGAFPAHASLARYMVEEAVEGDEPFRLRSWPFEVRSGAPAAGETSLGRYASGSSGDFLRRGSVLDRCGPRQRRMELHWINHRSKRDQQTAEADVAWSNKNTIRASVIRSSSLMRVHAQRCGSACDVQPHAH